MPPNTYFSIVYTFKQDILIYHAFKSLNDGNHKKSRL